MLKILITIGLLIMSNQVFAKSKCEQEWKALKSVQSQLRHKSTEYLRKKEHKKHDEYQNCRKAKKNKSKSSKTKNSHKSQTIYKKYNSPKSLNTNITNTVALKGKFSDEKQDAWIQYYDKPKECILPKNIQVFSRCLSERDEEAKKFDMEWNSK